MPKIRTVTAAATAAVLAALLLVVAGCAAAPEPAPSAEGGYTVTHAMGETRLTAPPSRVVVLDSPHLDALVALGVVPVGASESAAGAGFPPYLADRLTGTRPVGSISEPDLEAVAALQPDLIIGSAVRHTPLHTQLARIAPTVFSVGSGTDWTEQARITAAAVQRTGQMEDLLDRWRLRAEQVGEEVGASGRTASIVRFRPEAFRLYGPDSFSGSVLTTMGFDLGDRAWDEYSMREVGPELASEIDGDVVFFTDRAGDPTAGARGAVTRLWGDAPAVRAGRVHEVEDETWMVGIGVLGADRIVDDVRARLTG
ncbi:ABC transporter substrate-binding protein [Pseudonocardia sp. ICBG601]|uniref:ABC transporter substrate-binding protein n=1 Tax=Pseudonocardia sp. ICBG601 TaxID=2846759 RepID=UPI001CF660BE|nr:iron-siderophore ABC transporter substrate-binding protein [Pseudonocardia sp. ICBG601]